MKLANLILVPALILALAGLVTCQSRKPADEEATVAQGFRLKGGLVNLAEGDVKCACGGAPTGKLEARQTLASGDTIQVGDRGHAEVLLNPGYFLRLSSNSRVRLVDL